MVSKVLEQLDIIALREGRAHNSQRYGNNDQIDISTLTMNKKEVKYPLFPLTISAFLYKDNANQMAANTMHHYDVNI